MATTYTADQIDELLAQTRAEISGKIDKVIVLAQEEGKPSPEETSVWLSVEEVTDAPFYHND